MLRIYETWLQVGNAIGGIGQPDRQHRHKSSAWSRGFWRPRPKLIPVDLEERQVIREIVFDQLRREHIVACRNGVAS